MNIKKTKLQEAIDQFDPISTENIMNEAIKNIEKEIKEDEQLGRNTKSLENRLKKIKELEKRIRKKANKKIFGTTGVKIPIVEARDELYYELKDIWYGKAV